MYYIINIILLIFVELWNPDKWYHDIIHDITIKGNSSAFCLSNICLSIYWRYMPFQSTMYFRCILDVSMFMSITLVY